jgi:hypothetical protein
MTHYMDEICGKQHHRRAVAMLASMAFNSPVDSEDVRETLRQSTRRSAPPKSGIHREKTATNARGRTGVS